MNDSPCPLLGKFRGCKFQPRYDFSAANLTAMEIYTLSESEAEILRVKTYVRDVCIRCGRTIERGGV